MLHHRHRKTNAKPTSFGIGMADLAFVVLAIFLITLVPSEEAGFLMKLEPWSEEPPESYRVKRRNVFAIGIFIDDKLMVRGEYASFETLKASVIEFVSNPNKSLELAETPWQAKIFFSYERWTKYEDFISVIGSVKAAYWELWDKEAITRFKKPYSQLSKSEKHNIRTLIPFSFEAEVNWHCGSWQ